MPATTNLPAVTRPAVSIPIGGFKEIYDVDVVDRTLAELPAGTSDALKATYEKMLKAGRHAAHRQARRRARDGAPLRRAAELRRGARRREEADRALRLLLRSRWSSHRCCSSATGNRQDALRAPDLGPPLHRVRLRLDELAHRRLDPVGLVVAMEEPEAGQGLRDLPQRPVRQPAPRASTRSTRRPATRNTTRSGRSTRCSRSTPRASSSTSSSSFRSTPPARSGSRPRTTRRASRTRS